MEKDVQPLSSANLPTRMTIYRLTDSIREMAGRLAMPGAHDFAAKMHSDAIRAGTLVIVEPPPEPAPSVSVTVDAPEQTPSTPSDAPPKGEAPPAAPPKPKPTPKPRRSRSGSSNPTKAKQTA